jgi:solute carrier family 25 (mitochondrial carrier protein), member 16
MSKLLSRLTPKERNLLSSVVKSVRSSLFSEELCSQWESTIDTTPHNGMIFLQFLEQELKTVEESEQLSVLITYLHSLVSVIPLTDISAAYGWIQTSFQSNNLRLHLLLTEFVRDAMVADTQLKLAIFHLFIREYSLLVPSSHYSVTAISSTPSLSTTTSTTFNHPSFSSPFSLPTPNPAMATPIRPHQAILEGFAEKHTKNFFTTISNFISNPTTRCGALSLLNLIVQKCIPHLHDVVSSGTLSVLLSVLKTENEEIYMAVGCLCLTSLIPRILPSLPTILDDIFLIWKRTLCWNLTQKKKTKIHQNSTKQTSENLLPSTDIPFPAHLSAPLSAPAVSLNRDFEIGEEWETYALSSAYPPPCLRRPVSLLFYCLYGMFPAHLISFLQSECEENVRITDMIRPLVHRLNFNLSLIRTSKKTELTVGRWKNVTPEEILSQCLSRSILPLHPTTLSPSSLSLTNSTGVESSQHLLSNSLGNTSINPTTTTTTTTTTTSSSQGELPSLSLSSPNSTPTHSSSSSSSLLTALTSLGRTTPPLSSQTEQTELDRSKEMQSKLQLLIQFQFLLEQSLSLEAPPTLWGAEAEKDKMTDVAAMKRQIILLKNELLFERHLRQEYLNNLATHRKKAMEAVGQKEYLNGLSAKLKEQSEVNHTLQERFSEMTDIMQKREAELVKYNTQLIDEISRYKEDNRNLHQTVHDLHSQIAVLKGEKQTLQVQVAQQENALLLRDMRISDMTKWIEDQKEEKETLSHMEREIRSWTGHSTQTKQQNDNEQRDMNLLLKDEVISSLVEERETFNEHRKQSAESQIQHKRQIERMDRDVAELRSLTETLRSQQRSAAADFRNQIDKMQSRVESSDRTIAELQAELFRLRSENERLESRSSSTEGKSKE